ncbi:hypothetical protein EJ08DRAFT_644475 [Tothia fuscella]|uniref:Uncharacterized protein n=1 Tax=Tothia fuscella TaxID=1048955 RepID=A0A9P4P3T1_9PEZI|nr:hypothetical protein EJ08DRAFT_644475 [Tothia fuscella]
MDKAEKPDVKAASFRFKTGPWDVTSGTKANKDDEFASKIHRSCMASPACMSLDNESECGDDSAYSFSKNNIPVPCDTHLSEQSADSMETVKPEKHPEIALPSQVEIQKNYAEAERALSRMSVGEDEVMGEDSDAVSLDRISFGAMSCSSPSTVEIPTPESEKD